MQARLQSAFPWFEPDTAHAALWYRTLVGLARQRTGLAQRRCERVLDCLLTAASIHRRLQLVLAEHQLNESEFLLLTTLFATDPDPATTRDLTGNTGLPRSTVAAALHHLQDDGWVCLERPGADHRVTQCRLTDRGRPQTDHLLVAFLQRVEALAGKVEVPSRRPPPSDTFRS